jgi:AcrR family transcriptional regulator
MPTQAQRRAATRGRILDAARALLVEHGAETTTAMVLERAGVSRGALYHHFPSREDLVAAVVETTSATAIAGAARSVPSDLAPRAALVAGCSAWLRRVSEPAVATLLFDVGPAVLGWDRCRAIEDANSLRVMRMSLRAAVTAGEMEVPSIDLAARVLDAALSELALALAHGPCTAADVAAAATIVDGLVDGLGRVRP